MEAIMLLPVIDRTDGTQNKEACRECGGSCCQSYPGIAWPDDFGPIETLEDVLFDYLNTGRWSADFWEGDPRPDGELSRVYFIRPATIDRVGSVVDASWGGVCTLWSVQYGCSLSFNNRPRQCRTLKPRENMDDECFQPEGMSKEDAAIAWIPFQDQICNAIERTKGEEW